MASIKIGELLLQHGIISPAQLETALDIQRNKGGRVGDVLLGLGALSEETLQHFLARQFNLSFYQTQALLQRSVDYSLLSLLPYDKALQYLALPVALSSTGSCEIVTLAPLSEEQEIDVMRHLRCTALVYALAARSTLVQAIRHHYGLFMVSQTERAVEERTDPETARRHTRDMNLMRREGLYQPAGKADPLLQQDLGPWQLIRLLGEGGMGLVYEGRHSQTHQRSAIKILRTKLNVDDVAVQRFYREVQIMRRLRHPGIIEIYEFEFREDVGFYLVMELLQGCTFAEYLSQRSVELSFRTIYRVVASVCDAMHYAHQQNIVHRDLKPDNIYLVGTQPSDPDLQQSTIKVLDFGIAKFQQEENHRLTQTGSTLGTPHYISPEQAVAGKVDHRADIYSLSVILFEVLTGKSLFEAESPFQYLMRHVYAEPMTLSQARPDKYFPPELQSFLLRGLAKKPDDRPADMQEFKQQLMNALRPHLDGIEEEMEMSSAREKGVSYYHYQKNQDHDAPTPYELVSPSGSALPTGVPTGNAVRFMRSDEWDAASSTNLPASYAQTTQPDSKPAPASATGTKDKKTKSVLGLDSSPGTNTILDPQKNAGSSASGGILGKHLSPPKSGGDGASAASAKGSRPVVRSSAKSNVPQNKKVVIQSPRWDVSQRGRRSRRGFFGFFLFLLLAGGGGAGCYFYKDLLFPPPFSSSEKQAAALAWKQWQQAWKSLDEKAWNPPQRKKKRSRRTKRPRR